MSLAGFKSRSPTLREKITRNILGRWEPECKRRLMFRKIRRVGSERSADATESLLSVVLTAASAYERSVAVVEFTRNIPRARFCCHEFHFADEIASPAAVDLCAELALHGFELPSPGLAVGRYFKASGAAADGACVSRKRRSDDRWPRAGEPSECGFRALHPAQSAAEKCSCSFHGSGILTQEASS